MFCLCRSKAVKEDAITTCILDKSHEKNDASSLAIPSMVIEKEDDKINQNTAITNMKEEGLKKARDELSAYMNGFVPDRSMKPEEIERILVLFDNVLSFEPNEKFSKAREIFAGCLKQREPEEDMTTKMKRSVLKPDETIDDIDEAIAFSRVILRNGPTPAMQDQVGFEDAYRQLQMGKMDYATMRGLYG